MILSTKEIESLIQNYPDETGMRDMVSTMLIVRAAERRILERIKRDCLPHEEILIDPWARGFNYCRFLTSNNIDRLLN